MIQHDISHRVSADCYGLHKKGVKGPSSTPSGLDILPQHGSDIKERCWRLIMDLSATASTYLVHRRHSRTSCNNWPGKFACKIDIRQAYCNIPVAPEDKHLLGLQWNNQIYVDQVLPFGLRSVPMIFSPLGHPLH